MATRKKGAVKLNPLGEADSSNRRPTRLVYVHGIGWQEPPDDLRRLWDLALFGRELGATSPVGHSQMAFWADILHPERTTAAWTQRSLGLDRDLRTLDIERLLDDDGMFLRDERGEVSELVDALLRRFGVPRGSESRARVLPLPGFLRRPLAKAFLKAFVRDTAAYFFQPETRDRIRKRLEDALPADEAEDVVLVSHSMGTVIAFDVLQTRAAAGRPIRVRKFVTLGSPLGITEIQDHLATRPEIPADVREWTNFADPLDPVALDKGIGNDFERRHYRLDGVPPSLVTVQIEDVVLMNQRTLRGNPHAALGYLSHPKVRHAVAKAVHIDPMARFLVARDVAAELGELDRRQPVLFEIREPDSSADSDADGRGNRRSLASRVDRAAEDIERIVRETARATAEPPDDVDEAVERALDEARIDRLQRFVAARLLPTELLAVAARHEELFVYTVWKSTRKRKLVDRTARVVQADAARESYSAFGRGIAWAVLDTGVQANHPHFLEHGNVVAVWDCTRPGKPSNLLYRRAEDRDGHGTHVAGILAGEGSDHDGTLRRGIAPEAKLHVYKVLDDDGSGEDAWIIKALDHIAERNDNSSRPRIHGVNLSLGGPFDSTVYGCGFSPVCQELRRLWRNGVLVVVASGNEGKVEVETGDGAVELNSPMSIGDPANLEECIAVGSVHADKPHLYGISSFSSRGPTADGRAKPDCVAPGERIVSCNAHHAHEPAGKGRFYRAESGTSMAAPAVSGLLAAFLSARNEFIGRPDEVKALLLRTCTDLGRDRYHQGRGMPNLMKMLLES